MELKRTTLALENERNRRRAAKNFEKRRAEEETKRALTAEEWAAHWDDHVGRAQKIKELREIELRQRHLRAIQASEEAEKRRNEAAQQALEQKMKAMEERAAQSQLQSQEQYEKAVQEKRLKNELGKLKFATKRVMVSAPDYSFDSFLSTCTNFLTLNTNTQVERLAKKSEYEREMRQQEIDRKDAQTRSLKEAKTELRERRARQSRNFFVQQRQMAELQDKELQYLRFFGRPSGELKATRRQVEHQMMVTSRLLEGAPATHPADGEGKAAAADDEDEEEVDHFTALSAYHKSLLETGREWLLSSGSTASPRTTRRLAPLALSPR